MARITIDRHFHFYAAHRNEGLKGSKCWNIHGHTYDVDVSVLFHQKNKEVTMLFDDIEREIQPIIKELDHSFIINESDPLYAVLANFTDNGDQLKLYPVPFESNVENLAQHIGQTIYKRTGLNVVKIRLRETKSCVVEVGVEDIQKL